MGDWLHMACGWAIVMALTATSAAHPPDPLIRQSIVVGINQDNAPFEYIDEDGQPAGFNVDVVVALARTMGVTAQFRVGDATWIRSELESGKIDVIAGFVHSPYLAEPYNCTIPYMVIRYAVFARGDHPPAITSLEELKDHRVLVVRGTVMHEHMVALGYHDAIVPVDSDQRALRMLSSGMYDFALVPLLQGLKTADRFNLSNIHASTRPVYQSYQSMAVHRETYLLRANLNEGLAILRQTGQLDNITRRWFGSVENRELTLGKAAQYAAAAIGALTLLLIGSVIWSRSLRRQVTQRTREIQSGLKHREAAEAALRQSEARFRNLFENSPDAIFVESLEGDVLDVNPAGCRLHNRTREELIGINVLDLVPAEARESVSRDFPKVAAGDLSKFEGFSRIDDEVSVPVEVHVNHIEYGGRRSLLLHVRDISDRRCAEIALRDREQILRSYYDNASIMMGIVEPTDDNDVLLVSINRATAAFLNISPDAAAGRKASELGIAREHIDMWIEKYQMAERSGEPVRFQFEIRIASADWWLSATVCDLDQSPQGRPRFCFIVDDQTHRRRADEERARLEADLQQAQKLEAVGTLASGVAHDFSNIVTAINGYVDLAMRGLPADHPTSELLKMIRRAARQADGVTRSMLTFAHKAPTPTATIDMAVLVFESAEMLRHLLPTSIELDVRNALKGKAWVRADASRIQQVIMNLVLNARDAMCQGGKITLSLRHSQDEIALSVVDNGPGMTEETKKRLFEPFFTTKSRGKGTGLGLAVVHGIVTHHNGRIDVESVPGKGTTLTVFLPAAPTPTVSKPSNRRSPKSNIRKQTVLLAEDNEFVRRLMSASLRDAGYEVLESVDGEHALAEAQKAEENLHVAVLDLDMPHVSGETCIAMLREDRPRLPVIIVSGNVDRIAVVPQNDQWTRVITKPFLMADLVNAVTEMLDQQPA